MTEPVQQKVGFLYSMSLSIKQMIKLQPELANLSEAELECIKSELYEQAQLMFEVYWTRRRGSKNPLGLLPKLPNEGSVELWTRENKRQG